MPTFFYRFRNMFLLLDLRFYQLKYFQHLFYYKGYLLSPQNVILCGLASRRLMCDNTKKIRKKENQQLFSKCERVPTFSSQHETRPD